MVPHFCQRCGAAITDGRMVRDDGDTKAILYSHPECVRDGPWSNPIAVDYPQILPPGVGGGRRYLTAKELMERFCIGRPADAAEYEEDFVADAWTAAQETLQAVGADADGEPVTEAEQNLARMVIELCEAVRSDAERFDALWRSLPFQIRHRYGGDEREARVGVDILLRNPELMKKYSDARSSAS